MGVAVSPELLTPIRAELDMLQKEKENWRAEKEHLERERREARSAREAFERYSKNLAYGRKHTTKHQQIIHFFLHVLCSECAQLQVECQQLQEKQQQMQEELTEYEIIGNSIYTTVCITKPELYVHYRDERD